MINKEFIYEKVLPIIKEKGKVLDVLLIENIFENKEKEIIEELKTYQNEDKGLGHGLEPDIRMPHSSVAATNHGIEVLDQIKNKALKEDLCKDLVEFLENSFLADIERFPMVTKNVDDYPHAVWWNYEDILKNFTFGNPDPEVIGFLYKHRKHMKKLNINHLINLVVDYVKSEDFKEATHHTLMSLARFYKRVDKDVKNLIHDDLTKRVYEELVKDKDNWDGYALEPYKIYILAYELMGPSEELLNENLAYILKKVENLEVEVTWKWYRDDDVFEEVKNDWLGFIYFGMIKALRYHREI